jgi:hypothetical protein
MFEKGEEANRKDKVTKIEGILYKDLHEVIAYLVSCLRLCRTANGPLGQVPLGTKIGDNFAIIDSCGVPFVLRKAEAGYKVVGACYLHGVMHGELRDELTRKDPDESFMGKITFI